VTLSVHTCKNQNKLKPHHYSHPDIEKYQNRGIPMATFTGIDTVAAALCFRPCSCTEGIHSRIHLYKWKPHRIKFGGREETS